MQEARSFSLKRSPVTLLVNVSVVTSMGQVLHLLASQQKLPGESLVSGDIVAGTKRSRRFLGRREAMMGRDGIALVVVPSPVGCGGND